MYNTGFFYEVDPKDFYDRMDELYRVCLKQAKFERFLLRKSVRKLNPIIASCLKRNYIPLSGTDP